MLGHTHHSKLFGMWSNNMYLRLFLFFCVCSNVANAYSAQEYVSIVNLLAAPDKYQGKSVQVKGWVVFGVEHQAVYLTESDAKNAISKNALWISIDCPEQIEKTFAELYSLSGIFDKDFLGNGDLFSGSIKVSSKKSVDVFGCLPKGNN